MQVGGAKIKLWRAVQALDIFKENAANFSTKRFFYVSLFKIIKKIL